MNRHLDHPYRHRVLAWCALVMLAGPGCAAPLMTSYLSGSRRVEQEADTTATDAPLDEHDPKAVALRKANGQEPATPDEAMAGVLDELEQIRAIDPAAHAEVLANLKEAKPAQFELIVRPFLAALAYKQQLAEREREDALQMARDGLEPPASDATARPERTTRLVSRRAPTGSPSVAVAQTAQADALPPPPTELGAQRTSVATVPGGPIDVNLQQAAAIDELKAATPLTTNDWRRELDATIDDLERTLPEHPSTVAELHDFFRLRALQLVAGHEEEAYQPIPGASPAQQEYWSKQLFAMAVYLNRGSQLDDKHRAAAALVHLDAARTSLAELATLQIRNLAFVERIDGFGAYKPLTKTNFEPGAEVKLYAEVENFASTSTGEGFETRLATSYRVVDSGGRQIEASPFPEIVDVCQSRRRDFHLQYGFALPLRISPGEYRVELTITDQQSGKIGHGSAAFEINAAR